MTLGNAGVALAIAVVVSTAAGSRKSPKAGAVFLAVLVLALVVPLGELTLAGFARGLVGELSVTSLALLSCALLARCGGPALPARERNAVLASVAPGGLVLYPMALGLARFDPYSLGFGGGALLVALAALGLGGALLGLRLLPLVVAFAMAAFGLGLFESSNLWDYWIDAWVVVYALFWAVSRITVFVPRSKSR